MNDSPPPSALVGAVLAEAPPLIHTRGLSKRYPIYRSPRQRFAHALFGDRFVQPAFYTALDDVSVDVLPGEAVAVIGRNGAGKSTFLQLVAGVSQPSAGTIQVAKRTVGLLELGSGFNPEFTGRENVFLNGAIFGMSQAAIRDRLDSIVEFAAIGDFLDEPVKTYSSGMYLRLAFAVAVHTEPEVLLVDEALTVGDVFFQQKCYRKLEELRKSGTAILLVTHSMADAAEFCDRGIVLSQGRCVFAGSGKEAVEYYFHYEHDVPTGSRARLGAGEEKPLTVETGAAPQDGPLSRPAWLMHSAVRQVRDEPQVGDVSVRFSRLLITDENQRPAVVFRQGDWIKLHIEIIVERPLDVPLVGVEVINARGMFVHGRNSLQFKAAEVTRLEAGSSLYCEHAIKLDVEIGEYTIDLGFADIPLEAFDRRDRNLPQETHAHIRLLCHMHGAAVIQVVHRHQMQPCRFSHYGMTDLPSEQYLSALPTAQLTSSENK